jgi:acetyl esterase/lipase
MDTRTISRTAAAALFAVLLCLARPASASQHQETGFLNRTLTQSGTVYRYEVYLPEQYRKRQSWPVILFLHGSGERGTDGMDETQVGLASAIRSHPERWPFVVVMPQLPYGHHHWTDPDMMAMALNALSAEVQEFHGDPDRMYLTGLSLGAYGVWEIAKDYPGHFAALVPISGGIYWSYRPERWHDPQLPQAYARAIGRTPVWIIDGLLDAVVQPKQSEIMYSALAQSGGDVRLWEYEAWHHNVWDKAYADPDLPSWLLAHRLSQIPFARPEASHLVIPLHPVPIKVDPEIYSAYEGDYSDGEIRQLTVLRQGNRLFTRSRTGAMAELLPETTTRFFYPSGSPTRLTFERDSSGRVIGLLYHDDRHEEHWEKVH